MTSDRFAPLPAPPYYAVIFTNLLSDDTAGYDQMADKMGAMAAEQSGYLGIESTRDSDGFGITVSYWTDEAAIANWKGVAEHLFAQQMGKKNWYDYYITRVAKVERAYSGPKGRK